MPSKKRTVTAVVRRELAIFMRREHNVPLRQACRTARLARSAFYAPRPPKDDSAAIGAIEGCIEMNPRHGFDKLYPAVRGPALGKCRLYRVYQAEPQAPRQAMAACAGEGASRRSCSA